MSAYKKQAAIRIENRSPFLYLLSIGRYTSLMVSKLSILPTFRIEVMAFSLTIWSSLPTITSKGSQRLFICSLSVSISVRFPNYSLKCIISSWLQSILSISSVSIGISSSAVLSGPSSYAIDFRRWIEWSFAFGSSLLRSSIRIAMVLM